MKHNDRTIIKHYQLYQDYKELRKIAKERYGEIATYIASGYFYEQLSKRYKLTINYVCSIVSSIAADEDCYIQKYHRALFDENEMISSSKWLNEEIKRIAAECECSYLYVNLVLNKAIPPTSYFAQKVISKERELYGLQ